MPATSAAKTPRTVKCKWCKGSFSVTRIYPVQIYCNSTCCRNAFEHRKELKIADKILKRRERLRAKKAKAGKR